MATIPEISDPEAFEQVHDDVLLAMEEDPIEDPKENPEKDREDDPIEEEQVAPTSLTTDAIDEPTNDEGRWTDIHMYPSPLSSDINDYKELTPEPVGLEDAPVDDPDRPPSTPLLVVSAAYHDWLVGHMIANLVVADARAVELRVLLVAEREMRYTSLGGMRFVTPEETRRAMTGIELRSKVQLRGLPVVGNRLVSKVDAEQIFDDAMMRVRDLTRPADSP